MTSTARNNGGIASQLSATSSTSFLSMEEPPPRHTGTPPEYEALVQSARLRQKFNIQPREDEGCEKLPPYSCAISLENVLMRKVELEGAVHRAQDRNWYRVYASLQGTALTFYKWKGKGVFSKQPDRRDENPDFPAGTKKGSFFRSYNLQHADAGIAVDYFKKRYVIRVRAETDQFLLSCMKIETFVQWLQCLFAAIDLAPPLDDREIPRDLSTPRPRRRRIPVQFAGDIRGGDEITRNAEMVREQYEIIRRHYPGLVNMEQPGAEVSQTAIVEALTGLQEVGIMQVSSSINAATRTTSAPTIPTVRSQTPSLELTRPATAPPLNPSIDLETGKWRPEHHWSAMYDMIYAKRCSPILNARSPRKSNFIIIKGKRWLVDWATGKLTRVEPPEYGEIEGRFESANGGELRVGQYGTLVRV